MAWQACEEQQQTGWGSSEGNGSKKETAVKYETLWGMKKLSDAMGSIHALLYSPRLGGRFSLFSCHYSGRNIVAVKVMFSAARKLPRLDGCHCYLRPYFLFSDVIDPPFPPKYNVLCPPKKSSLGRNHWNSPLGLEIECRNDIGECLPALQQREKVGKDGWELHQVIPGRREREKLDMDSPCDLANHCKFIQGYAS